MKKFIPFFVCALLLVACERNKESLETQQLTATEVTYLTEAHTDSLYLHFEIEVPTLLHNDTATAHIQNSLTEHLFGSSYTAMPMEQAMKAYMRVLQADYMDNNASLKAEADEEEDEELAGFSAFCNNNEITARVMGVVGNVLSYGIEQYIYMGGAHGINNRWFYNYDSRTGYALTEADFFVPNYQASLTALLHQNLIAQEEECDSEKELASLGYYLSEIVPNNNFYITEEGFHYVFNPYDIAPYVMGDTEILVKMEQLADLLIPTNPLH